MDDGRFDQLARALATPSASRRGALRGLVGGALGAVAGGLVIREANAGKCPQRRKCGRDCCHGKKCFGQRDADTGKRKRFCCPAGALCRSIDRPDRDQCCYKDETCRPQRPDRAQFGICCRECGGACCEWNQVCNKQTLVCEELDTARLPRYRR